MNDKSLIESEQPSIQTVGNGFANAEQVAQQALAYHQVGASQINQLGQASDAETQGVFAFLGLFLGLASGVMSVIGGVNSRSPSPVLQVLTIKLRNLTNFPLLITNNYTSNSRVSASPTLLPGETLDYLFHVSPDPFPDGHHSLEVSVLNRGTPNRLRFGFRHTGDLATGVYKIHRVTLNNNPDLQDPLSGGASHPFYTLPVGFSNVRLSVFGSTVRQPARGKLELCILSPSL
ncbi:hypothetical protein [Pseudomonas soli]|uniref:hypothetical protein n=1 Tax=Pseudomonas soli TaxID=1306993 RepID=UPI00299D936A|nr:hypothetical protein [Pseudomonas soli]MDW9402160.1 hypothetical protein [Pseudomonas soli]